MAFYPLEYLEQGKVSFIYKFPQHDINELIKKIRLSPNRKKIVAGFIGELKETFPTFCFEIIYDMEEYKEETFNLLETKLGYERLNENEEKISNLLENTSFGKEYISNNLDIVLSSNDNNLENILHYLFLEPEKNQDLIKKLYLHKNLHVRAKFMKYIVKYHNNLLNDIYDDITKYLTSYTHQENEQLTFLPELMQVEDISELAIAAYDINDKELWIKLKEYILKNYERNNLAKKLLSKVVLQDLEKPLGSITQVAKQDDKAELEFLTDIDRLFLTSQNYKMHIYNRYSQHISKEMLDNFVRIINIFSKKDKDYNFALSNISNYGLFDTLEKYVDKYLSLSKNETYEFIRDGSTSSTYRIGDFVFKLNSSKWSYEDVICPNLYLILKNLEEDYIRDKNGIVRAGIEVQKYLKKSAKHLPRMEFVEFRRELKKLGYYITDSLINGCCGDNCMLLDTYKDADYSNPELLPEEFKKTPLVLIDRDRVYKLENKFPKQLSESY